MEFLKSLMTSENAVNLGGGFILIGIIIILTPRILGGHFEACDQARQALKNEAQQRGQDDRYNRLTAEEKGTLRMPMYGNIPGEYSGDMGIFRGEYSGDIIQIKT